MDKQKTKKVLAVVDDLFFSVKISDAAKKAGLALEFLKGPGALLEAAEGYPTLIIFDLNNSSVDPLQLISQLKGNQELKRIPLLGYLSHIQADLKLKAQEAGCDVVLARSAFSTNLMMILKRHAGAR